MNDLNKIKLMDTTKDTFKKINDNFTEVELAVENVENSKANKASGLSAGTNKTKISYNADGIVVSGSNATLDDILDGSSRKLTDYVKHSEVVNSLDSQSITNPLSANMGKNLSDRINNLDARGKFLSLWDSSTGLPESEPDSLPYIYHTGDYFVVSIVGVSNKKPSGTQYNGTASTTLETDAIKVNDAYYFDGTNWKLQKNDIDTTTFVTNVGYNSSTKKLTQTINGTTTNVTSVVVSVDGESGAVDLSSKYLGKTSKAADSDKLDGYDSTYFATKQSVDDIDTILDGFGDIVTHNASEFQTKLTSQTAYSGKGTSTKVAKITTNNLGQVTAVEEVDIDFSSVDTKTIYTFTANDSRYGALQDGVYTLTIQNTNKYPIACYNANGESVMVTLGQANNTITMKTDEKFAGTIVAL